MLYRTFDAAYDIGHAHRIYQDAQDAIDRARHIRAGISIRKRCVRLGGRDLPLNAVLRHGSHLRQFTKITWTLQVMDGYTTHFAALPFAL